MRDLSRYKAALLSTTAITRVAAVTLIAGGMSLPAIDPARAQCAPLTAAADNVVCAGALDGTSSDALAGNDTITFITNVGVNAGATVSGGADNDTIALTAGDYLGVNAGGAGQVLGDAGADTITLNSGRVGNFGAGTVSGGLGADSIALSNDSYIGYGFSSTGQVLGDAGADTITIDSSYVGRGGAGTVSGGDGADSIALSNNSVIGYSAGSTGQVLGDAGADTITLVASRVGNSGAGTVSGGADNDSIALSNNGFIGFNTNATGQVLGDAGADTITLNFIYVGYRGGGTVSGGDDADSIALSNRSVIGYRSSSTGQVLGDAGADTITIDNSSVGYIGAGTVSGGDDGDSIALSNGSRIGDDAGSTGQVLGDAGNDTITLDNSDVGFRGAGTVSGGADNDSIALSNGSIIGADAGVTGQVLGNTGADTITIDNSRVGNSGAGTVSGGADNDSIALSNGSVIGNLAGSTGQVLGDAGADTITIDNSTIGNAGSATVDGGADNDSIALSGGTTVGALGQVLGSAGNDTVSLDDSVVRNAGALFDGGANTDQLVFTANGNATVPTGEFVNFEDLQKNGAGTLTLTGNQTFTDSANVNAGTLVVGGQLTSALTTINAGARLNTSGGSFVGSVANSGTFSPGGDGTVETVAISGNFTQGATGTLNVDVSPTNDQADRLNVGGTATLGGTLGLTALGAIAPENRYILIDAAGGVVGNFATVAQSAAITQSVAIDGTRVVLRQVADFAANAGTPNQNATGTNLNEILVIGPSGNLQTVITALAGIVDVATFQTALDQLHAEPYLAQHLSTWISGADFFRTMLSCPESDEGAMSIGNEGECVWAKVGARSFDQDRTSNNIGIDETATNVSGGVQFEIAEDWHAGFGARYEHVASTIDTRAKTKGDRFDFAGSLKARFGDTTLAAVLSGGFGDFDTTRFINIAGLSFTANGEQDVTHAGAHARLAHNFTQDHWYVRPMVDVAATYIHLSSLTETGAGNIGLRVGSTDEWIFSATPAVEIGAEFEHGSAATVRPFIRAGITLLSDDDISHATSFLGAPAGVNSFRITTEFDNVFATIETGVDIIGTGGLNLKFNYDGRFAENTQIHAGGLKLGIKF